MGIWTREQLTEKQRGRVREYAGLEDGEELQHLYDRTTLGSAKAGFALTDRRAILYDKRQVTAIRFADVTKVVIAVFATTPPRRAIELTGMASTAARGESPAPCQSVVVDVFLDDAGMRQLADLIRARVPAGTSVFQNDKPKDWEQRVHRGTSGFILTTTPTIEGRPIREYLGIVSGEAVIGANVFADIAASITD